MHTHVHYVRTYTHCFKSLDLIEFFGGSTPKLVPAYAMVMVCTQYDGPVPHSNTWYGIIGANGTCLDPCSKSGVQTDVQTGNWSQPLVSPKIEAKNHHRFCSPLRSKRSHLWAILSFKQNLFEQKETFY